MMRWSYGLPEPDDDAELDAYEDYVTDCEETGAPQVEFEEWQEERRDIARRVDEERAVAAWEELHG